MNFTTEEEISEFVADPVEQLDADSLEEAKLTETKRGRRAIPEAWTRVISMSTDNLNNLFTYPISTDLLVEQGYDKTRRRKDEPVWEIHFSPKQYIEMHPNPDLERNRLSVDRLARYGEQVTKIRGWILERASQEDTGPRLSQA